MNWSDTANVLQVIYWTLMFCIFINGYSVGSRTVI